MRRELVGRKCVLIRDYHGYTYEDDTKMIVPAPMMAVVREDEGLDYVLVEFNGWFSDWWVDLTDLYFPLF